MIKKLAPLWIALAGILWGMMGIFVRRFNAYGVEAMSVVFIRALLTAVLTAAVCAVYDAKLLKIKLKDIWIFAGAGIVSMVFFNYCYFSAINLMSLSAAAILLYTSPVFVTLFSAVIFKEKITLKKVISIILSIVGLAFVTGIIGGGTGITAGGIVYGICSAVGYGLYSIFNRFAINRGYSALTMVCWSFLFAAVCSVFLADLSAVGSMISANIMMLPFSVLFAVLISVIPYFLYSIGLKGTENGKAAVIASIEPVAATVLGIFLYKEYLSLFSVIGIILVFSAMLLSIEFKKA